MRKERIGEMQRPVQGESSTDLEASLRDALPRLSRDVRYLFQCLPFLELEEEEENLLTVSRQLLVWELFDQRPTIAVIGLQGAGKSTLVGQLYGLGPDLVPQNVGRGEKLPLRIIERQDAVCPSGFVHRLAGLDESARDGSTVVRESLATTDGSFCRRARAPERQDLLMELEVPPRHFGGGDAALLLLPGFEDIDKRREWDSVARFSSAAATAVILAVDPARLPLDESKKLLRQTVGRFGLERTVVALTMADLRPDANQELRERLVEELEVPEVLGQRVIAVGANDRLRDSWLPKLGAMLSSLVPSARAYRSESVAFLRRVAGEQLRSSTSKIKRKLDQFDIEIGSEKLDIDALLEPLRKSSQELRARYKERLAEELMVQQDKALACARDQFIGKDHFAKILRSLIGVSVKDVRRFEEQIRKAWLQPETDCSLEKSHLRVLGDLVHQELGIPLLDDSKRSRAVAVYGKVGESEPVRVERSEEVQRSLQLLLEGANEDDRRSFDEVNESLRLLPVLVLEYARLHGAAAMDFHVDGTMSIEQRQSFTKLFEESTATQKKVFGLLGSLLLLDGAYDGSVDSLPNLVKALGFGGVAAAKSAAGATGTATAATAGAGVGVGVGVAAVAGGIAAAVTLVYLARRVRSSDLRHDELARGLFAGAAEATTDAVLRKYDRAIAAVEDAIIRNLNRLYRVPSRQSRALRLGVALARTRESRIRIMEALNAERLLV